MATLTSAASVGPERTQVNRVSLWHLLEARFVRTWTPLQEAVYQLPLEVIELDDGYDVIDITEEYEVIEYEL